LARQPSLRSQLNQIRSWVRQGRTDAWISHQLDVSIEQLERFKREHDLAEAEQVAGPAVDPLSIPVPEPGDFEFGDDEDDEEEEEEDVGSDSGRSTRSGGGRGSRRGRRGGRGRSSERPREKPRDGRDGDDRDGEERGKRRRGRRGGRRRRSKVPNYEATFEHGGEGYGFWIDPSVVDNPVYSEHWAGHRAIVVRIDPDSITIQRADPNRAPE
jgi:hypothetical protein